MVPFSTLRKWIREIIGFTLITFLCLIYTCLDYLNKLELNFETTLFLVLGTEFSTGMQVEWNLNKALSVRRQTLKER